MHLYWGDLHNHCGISYGFGSLENALRNARVHLDFCGVTGHAMWPDMVERNPETAFVVDFHEKGFEKLRRLWPEVQRTVNEANTADFVTFQTYEMHSSRYGDRHFVSPDPDFPLIYRDSPDDLIRDCGCRAMAVPHHIGYAPGYRGINWNLFREDISPVVEVVSKHGSAMREDGPFPYYHDMGPLDARCTVAEGLRRGYRFSFVGSTDHHAGFPGSWGDGLAAVLAPEKTRESIWEALKQGRCYAVSADRIRCSFSVNEAMMGGLLSADTRRGLLEAEGDAPVELSVVRKNGRIIARDVPVVLPSVDPDGRYIFRVEMGWSSSPEKYHWEGCLRIMGGRIRAVRPYLRGMNALSPGDSEADREEETNHLDHGWSAEEDTVFFRCDTVRNVSTRHPQTCAFVVEAEADPDAETELRLNGKNYRASLRSLLQAGYADHMKPWHSHAFKMHTVWPLSACRTRIEWTDGRESPWDVYQAEVVQVNGSRAFISPVFVR